MASCECLPEHHADRPDVGGLGGERAGKAFRRDVGERSGNVALGGQGLGLLDLGEAEVEHLRVNPAALCQQDVRRLDVTVDDPAPVSVRQGLEDLGRSLDRGRVVELAASQRFAEGATRDVLVGDVDVLRVAAETVGALARRMTEARGRLGLSLGSGRRLPLPRHDLQGHVEPVLLVAGEPDRAGTAAPQRPQRPVAAENEVALDKG